jgi:glycosyltransferase involved in cell wall biosynthesis
MFGGCSSLSQQHTPSRGLLWPSFVVLVQTSPMRYEAIAEDRASRCTVVVPSLNQGRFLDATLTSIFAAGDAVQVGVMDGGSSDGSRHILERWRPRLAWLQIAPDGGQAAAINAGMERARTPFVAWLNADDLYLAGGLDKLCDVLSANPHAPAAFGRAEVIDATGRRIGQYSTERFDRDRFARRCFIAQPATVIRRSAWCAVGGLDASLAMAMDYDLWWRLSESFGSLAYCDEAVAATRAHLATKTIRYPVAHYREAFGVLRKHYGRVPMYWFAKAPLSIGLRLVAGMVDRVVQK